MDRQERFEAQQEIAIRNALSDLFEHEAWPLVTDMVEAEVEARTNTLVSVGPDSMSLEQAAYLRGQINTFKWLLSLKADNRIERDRLKQEIEEEEEDA